MKLLRGTPGILACLIFVFVVEFIVLVLPPDLYEWVIKENGLIEDASVVGYLLAACWLLTCGVTNRLSHGFASGALVLGLALRELDFHVRFTTMGIFKTRFYLTNEVPVPEKIIVSIIVTIMLAALCWYALKYGPAFMEGLRRKSSDAICILLAIIYACITKTLDRNSFEINEFLMTYLSIDSATVVRVSEEVLEFGIPLLILLAIYNNLADKRATNK